VGCRQHPKARQAGDAAINRPAKWDIDDLRGYYAAFGRRQLPDAAHYTAAVADSTLPDNHVGYDLWITWVAEVPFFERSLIEWAEGLGELAATLKPRIGERRRTFVESYRPEWGRQASRDGLRIAILGPNFVPGLQTRATELGMPLAGVQEDPRLRGGCCADADAAVRGPVDVGHAAEAARLRNGTGSSRHGGLKKPAKLMGYWSKSADAPASAPRFDGANIRESA
jgi:hypothetical protein